MCAPSVAIVERTALTAVNADGDFAQTPLTSPLEKLHRRKNGARQGATGKGTPGPPHNREVVALAGAGLRAFDRLCVSEAGTRHVQERFSLTGT